MRTPNSKCVICSKPLYRRPFEKVKARYAACRKHRAKAQSVIGVTEAQQEALKLGRPKGTNHRTGYKHKDSSKRKATKANRKFWKLHPEKLVSRGEKTRGELHYNWKGGSTRINTSIRRMTENRKWMDAVKERDGACLKCGSTKKLEAHHVVDLAVLIRQYGIKNRNDARRCPALWDLSNGETYCEKCHYKLHGRKYAN